MLISYSNKFITTSIALILTVSWKTLAKLVQSGTTTFDSSNYSEPGFKSNYVLEYISKNYLNSKL